MQLNHFTKSSSNPNQVSMTVSGVVALAIPLMVSVVRQSGVDVPADVITNELQALIDIVLLFVQQVTTAISSLLIIIGGVRRIYNLYVKPIFVKK